MEGYESEIDGIGADVRREYADFDFSHEPFLRRETESARVEDPIYSEVDEMWVRELEEITFHPETHFPRPPEGLAPNHALQVAWDALLEAREKLHGSVDEVKESHEYFQSRIHNVMQEETSEELSPEVREMVRRYAKDRLRENFHLKKCYFQRALAYLYLYRDAPETVTDTRSEELLRQVEVIFVAHTSYPVVRSATHLFGARRQNKDLVMDHVYKTCVYVMNRFQRLLHQAKNIEEMHQLYEMLLIGILVATPHDYLEDFESMTEGFLDDKMSEHLTFDTIIETPLRRAPFAKNVPNRTNPHSRNRESILKCLKALTKPEKGSADRENYLDKQIVQNTQLGRWEKIICALVKSGDRRHNLATLSAKPLAKQVSYLNETIDEVIAMVTQVRKETGAEFLSDDLFSLNLAVSQIAGQMLHHQAEALAELGLTETVHSIIRRSFVQGAGGLLAEELFKDLI